LASIHDLHAFRLAPPCSSPQSAQQLAINFCQRNEFQTVLHVLRLTARRLSSFIHSSLTVAMAGHELSRCRLGTMEAKSGNVERAVKHWASGISWVLYFHKKLYDCFEQGRVHRDAIDLTLTAHNDSCAEMRSEERDTYIRNVNKSQIKSYT